MSTPVHRTPTRPSVAAPTVKQRREGSRAGSPSGNSAEHAFLRFQSSVGNRAATAAVQRARSATGERTAEATGAAGQQATGGGGGADGARQRKSYRDRINAVLDRFKKNLEPTDNIVKGGQTPTNAALTHQAGANADGALKSDAAISGTSAAGWNALTEASGVVVSTMDAYKNMKDSKSNETGAKHHTASRKAKTKGADAGVGAVSSGSYGAAIAKEATKVQGAANAATAAEASGALSAVTGLAKGARALVRVGGATSKYKNVKALGDANVVNATLLARLDREVHMSVHRANAARAEAYARLDAAEAHPHEGWQEGVDAAFATFEREFRSVRPAEEAYRRAVKETADLSQVQKYAKKKQVTKIGKETVGGVMGEPAKAAAGVLTLVTATGALASNPAGWILAAVGAGLVLATTGYKAGRAATKRYDEKRHPDRFTLEGETAEDAVPRTESLKHALKFWKKVSKGERQAMARKIYGLAAGPDVPGSGGTTPQLRQSARELLIALKAGPAQHKLDPEAWETTLNDPAKKGGWISEIAEQLASG
ncbi:hypothetical protein GCM10022384_45040 [Streptomyces marokkonensis]|uniref:Uncharacterized protein n=1 Tax=Streptomyces marokkonensis TaxID=324855 RepID=A0ABP7R5I6_9ACTN